MRPNCIQQRDFLCVPSVQTIRDNSLLAKPLLYYPYMSPFFRVPLGIFVMIVGFLMVQKTDVVLEWFGEVPFAEEKMGPGMSRTFYKLLGVGVVIIGMAITTNVITGMLESFARLLTGGR